MYTIFYLVPICIYSLAIIIIVTLIWGAINFKNIVKKDSKSFKFYIIALGIIIIGLCLGISDLRMFSFLLLGMYLLLLTFIPPISISLLIIATIFSIILLILNRALLFKIYFWIVTVVFLLVSLFFTYYYLIYEYENEDFEQNKQSFIEAIELVETLAKEQNAETVRISFVDYSIEINDERSDELYVPTSYRTAIDAIKECGVYEIEYDTNGTIEEAKNDIIFGFGDNEAMFVYSPDETTIRELKKIYKVYQENPGYDLGEGFFFFDERGFFRH